VLLGRLLLAVARQAVAYGLFDLQPHQAAVDVADQVLANCLNRVEVGLGPFELFDQPFRSRIDVACLGETAGEFVVANAVPSPPMSQEIERAEAVKCPDSLPLGSVRPPGDSLLTSSIRTDFEKPLDLAKGIAREALISAHRIHCEHA